MDFALDFGNARIKWFNPRTNAYSDFRHAIVQLSENDWNRVTGRGTPPEGFIRVNGTPFVVGDSARRYLISERPRGASRYRDIYYGVGMAYALSEGLRKNVGNVTLFATHPPGDIAYTKNLCSAAKGDWEIVSRQGGLSFSVNQVETMDEPLAGYSHFVFTEKGVEKNGNELAGVTTLVVDVGGYTTDVAAVDPNGEIDPLSLKSVRTGVISATDEFETNLRGNNATLFIDTGDIDIRRIEQALLIGKYKFGKLNIDCKAEAEAALNSLTNDVIQVINSAGGVANYDVMLLTGGGSALLEKRLVKSIPRAEFILADSQQLNMKYANVFGAAKIGAMLRNLNLIQGL